MNSKPQLFSKRAILLLSLLYTPLFGAFVYASNLQAVEKRNFILPTILTMLVVNWLIFSKLIPQSGLPFYIAWPVLCAIGGSIINGPFWEHHINAEIEFETKKIWSPLFAGLFIYGSFILMVLYLKSQAS